MSLLHNAGKFYEQCPGDARRLLNQAVYERIRVGKDESETAGEASEVVGVVERLRNSTVTGRKMAKTTAQTA